MQRDDGSWGHFDRGTAEETAYALLTLLHFHRRFGLIDVNVLKRGAAYLWQASEANDSYPDLWIAKSLFAPTGIIQAAILSARYLYEETFGRPPG